METRAFSCDEDGFIRHWIKAGPYATPYAGPPGNDDTLRVSSVDDNIEEPPSHVALAAPGPHGGNWELYDPGANVFVEQSGVYPIRSILNFYGATDVEVDEDCELPARFWSCGAADLWVNGHHVSRHNVPRYMYPDVMEVVLPFQRHRNQPDTANQAIALKKGRNRIVVRLQVFGVRDTRVLFGLQICEGAERLSVFLPAPDLFTEKAVEIDNWLSGLRAVDENTLKADAPAPYDAVLTTERETINWPQGKDRVETGRSFQAILRINEEG